MKADKCLGGERLLLYAAGELTPEERAEVEEHVVSCAQCRAAAAGFEKLGRALREAGRLGRRDGGRTQSCPEDETLAAYADGSIAADRRPEIEHHLVGCRRCLAEVADLWRLAGPEVEEAPQRSVAAVVERLERESGAAIVRWTERALELVRGFGAELRAVVDGGPALAAATTRATPGAVALRWESGGGTRLEAEVSRERGGALLTGRVTFDGEAATAVSVSMRSSGGRRGPESPDPSGRFGPWPLAPGENTVSLRGIAGGEDLREELLLLLEADEKQGSGDAPAR